MTNQQIIEQMYHDFATGNIPAVLTAFSKDVIWTRPGAPFIPFSGIFTGIDEVMKMLGIQNKTLKLKTFVPDKICTNNDTVMVLGHDEAEAIETGKSYSEDWMQVFTFQNEKIIHVQVFMDTKVIADAFQK
ncbi:MAG TPA: nuclear transport factor 2 family protein [Hanamia sp.]|nr:nuclear transport factor 2 family protein [Hanamia sp.]